MTWIRFAAFSVCCFSVAHGLAYGQTLAELLDGEDRSAGDREAAAQAQAPARTPIPDAKALQEARTQIRNVFMADARAAPTPDAKAALANQLVSVVPEERDPAMRYALLQACIELAIDGGTIDVATNAIGQMAAEFEVDGEELKQAAYIRMTEAAPGDAQGPIIDALLNAAEQAAGRSKFDEAESLIKHAITASRRAKDRKRQANAVEGLNQVKTKRKAAERLQPFFERLKEDPADQAASLAIGKQWCFADGRWDEGLPYLARAGDPMLSGAARAELQAKGDLNAKFAAAELWEKVFAAASKADKQIIGQHIVNLYMAALPGLTGLARVRAEKAIEEIQSAMPKSALEEAWLVVFRSNNASIWDTDTREGINRFAVKLSDVPDNIRFLRMRSSDGDSVIIPISKASLAHYICGKNYIWTGYKQVIYGATVLGIGDRTQNVMGKPGVPVAIRTGEWCTGYGFGPDSTAKNAPTPAWANKRAPGLIIEISVTSRPLTPEEQRLLLDMGEIEPAK
jgi:hypothetical protein